MDLAARCADLLLRLRSAGRRRPLQPLPQDPADMGTANGLEASLAPPPDLDDDAPSSGHGAHAASWLRPR